MQTNIPKEISKQISLLTPTTKIETQIIQHDPQSLQHFKSRVATYTIPKYKFFLLLINNRVDGIQSH